MIKVDKSVSPHDSKRGAGDKHEPLRASRTVAFHAILFVIHFSVRLCRLRSRAAAQFCASKGCVWLLLFLPVLIPPTATRRTLTSLAGQSAAVGQLAHRADPDACRLVEGRPLNLFVRFVDFIPSRLLGGQRGAASRNSYSTSSSSIIGEG